MGKETLLIQNSEKGYERVKYMMDHSWDDTYSVDQTTCDARFVQGESRNADGRFPGVSTTTSLWMKILNLAYLQFRIPRNRIN